MSDVREALASRLERSFGPFLAHWPHDPARFFGGAADEVMSTFEVRPHGTVTPPADDVRKAVEAAREELALLDVGAAPGSDTRECLRGLLAVMPTIEVRPRGTVTDAEVEWEYGVRHVAVDGWPTDRVRSSLDAARADLETCGMNCHLIRRRSARDAGRWEAFHASCEDGS